MMDLRTAIASIGLLLAMAARAQVELDRPLRFTGAADQRGADQVANPVHGSDALTVRASLLGKPHWSTATVAGQQINVTPAVPITTLREGTLLRFSVPQPVHDTVRVVVTGDGQPRPLVRPDGLPPVRGQLRTGAVAEIVLAGDRWTLLGAEERGCPAGYVQVNERLCIEVQDVQNITFFNAVERCERAGGKLCMWDEWYTACVLVGNQLSGLFNAWEWIDDTSNHTHTADQVGLNNCTTQRTWYLPTQTGEARCCYHLR